MGLRTGKRGGTANVSNCDELNKVLVELFNDAMDIEKKAIITGDFKDITNNDIHVIEAIGVGKPRNMSSIAKSISVTVGTLTIAINQLVRKGYAERIKSEADKRVVLISLTEKGKRAYEHHQKFHQKMTQAVIQGTREEEVIILLNALIKLRNHFRTYKHK